MTERTGRPWLNYLLGLLCVGAIAAAVLVVGPASGSSTAVARTAKATQGVVQATVSGSGNLQPASQLNLGFKTGGTVTRVYVSQGEHVTEGRLLAELDPSGAEVNLEQARANLQAAEANLAQEEETGGEPSSSRSSTTTPVSANAAAANAKPTSPTLSAATREANLASAKAMVKSDQLTVRSDEEALADTKLYAPQTGTIVTLSGQVGEVVSASGVTRASSSSSPSSSGSGSTGGSSGRSAAAGGSTGSAGSSASSASSGSSSTAFAVLSDLSSMNLVVALSESEIGRVKVGQVATVTVEALAGRQLAAHVSEVATLSTSSSGVVSYDVTFQLDQMETGLKPGMSATAEVVVSQAEGVSVPTSAISAGTVTVTSGAKVVRRRVVTGLAGNSSTIILSGVTAGETVVLPAATSTSSATSLTSRLSRIGGGSGGGGLGGGGSGFTGSGGAAFFRGGG
jgi:multidrug efflux pump subunit AcrA (membrane-fusion protein)